MIEGREETASSDSTGQAQIFVCDASAEAGRLLSALRGRGYHVVDVPLGLLPNRIRYEVPQLVICDADAHEAHQRLEEVASESPQAITLMLVGQPDGALAKNPELSKMASERWVRPIDVDKTVEKIGKLIGVPTKKRSHRPKHSRGVRAPSLVAAARRPYRSDGRRSTPQPRLPSLEESLSPPSIDPRSPFGQRSEGLSLSPPTSTPLSSGGHQLSAATTDLLKQGRRRLDAYPERGPRPVRLQRAITDAGENIRSDFVAALAEPLDGFAQDDKNPLSQPTKGTETVGVASDPKAAAESRPTVAPGLSGPLRAPGLTLDPLLDNERTNPGGRPVSQPPSQPSLKMSQPQPPLDDLSDLLVPRSSPTDSLGRPAATISNMPDSLGAPGAVVRPQRDAPPPPHLASTNLAAGSGAAPGRTDSEAMINGASHPSDSQNPPAAKQSVLTLLGWAVATRKTGAVAVQDGSGVRRIVVADGDIATASSSLEAEGLPQFLVLRGDYDQEMLTTLGPVPSFGRHAGAALVARGLFSQEELWPVLRAHAEWVLNSALRSVGTAMFETKIPTRLREEPAVFGGAAGAEIFVESVRRTFSPEQSFVRLGAGERKLGVGPHLDLLRESALSADEQELVIKSVASPLAALLETNPGLLPIVLACTELGVLTAGGELGPPPADDRMERSREIDDEAFALRVRSRMSVVEDGDYFHVLGIPRSATRYEVERAWTELKAQYSEERLTPRTQHLREQLLLMRATFDQAHLVLIDDVRRYRYRQALEAEPQPA